MSRLQLAIEQITFARNKTIRLLDSTKADDWFRRPQGGVTHIAWQVGHLALGQYRLALERIRGAKLQDENLISAQFMSLFGRNSVRNLTLLSTQPRPKSAPFSTKFTGRLFVSFRTLMTPNWTNRF